MGDRGNRWQRLAAEAERGNPAQVLGSPDLARGVALDGQPGVIRLHAFPIVLNANLLLAAELDVNRDAAGAGIDGVLDELLDDGGWAFDDFSRGNLIGEVRGKRTILVIGRWSIANLDRERRLSGRQPGDRHTIR